MTRFVLFVIAIVLPVFGQETTPREDLEQARAKERNILDEINEVDRQLYDISTETADLQ